jgi:hypothetical protein
MNLPSLSVVAIYLHPGYDECVQEFDEMVHIFPLL